MNEINYIYILIHVVTDMQSNEQWAMISQTVLKVIKCISLVKIFAPCAISENRQRFLYFWYFYNFIFPKRSRKSLEGTKYRLAKPIPWFQ